ncbi:MAG: enoyl-CoA hydratase/isomerase family protein [Alphaproteobacteria bacterium]|nr:enoyl-CoA hydratase/isomerase family protein [Alphaproteobacteria bacterium]
MTTAPQDDYSIAIFDHIAHIRLTRPPHNMMTLSLAHSLADTLETLDAREDVRAVVLSAEGRSFCAGADLSRRPDQAKEETRPDRNPLYDAAVRLGATQTPIVAAVQGPAIGAGLGLALIADFRVASPEARFAANFVKLGFHPGFGLTYTLPQAIGPQRARLMCLTGRRIRPDEALNWGLIDALTEENGLLETAIALARDIAEGAPLAVKATRASLRPDLAAHIRKHTDHEHAEQVRLMKTADFAEGVRAVAERRPGRFTGR